MTLLTDEHYKALKETQKMKRQGMMVSIKDLVDKAKELCDETEWDGCGMDVNRKILIPIINKSPKCSDTWEFE